METESKSKLRWFHLTPGWLLLILLVIEAVLLLSERFQWFAFNEHNGWTVLIAVAAVGLFLLLMCFWFILALVFRRRFQFTLRSLLVLTVAVALPCSWLAVELKRAREQKKAEKAILELGGSTGYQDYDTGAQNMRINWEKLSGSVWLRGLLGDHFFIKVISINLSETEITDIGLEQFKGLKQLQILDLSHTKVTEAGVAELQKALPSCKIRMGCVGNRESEQGI